MTAFVVSFLFVQTAYSIARYGSNFACQGRNECYDDQIHCEDGTDCIVHCSGVNACQYAMIHCPKDAVCNVICDGGIDACKDAVFLALDSAALSLSCDRTQEESCDETVVYCPNNGRGGIVSCQISGVSSVNVKKKMEIFAVEGLNDVQILGTELANAHLYCKEDYSSPCTLSKTSPFDECTDDKTCETYLLPIDSTPTIRATPMPTNKITPTPITPTIRITPSPTTTTTPSPTVMSTSTPAPVTNSNGGSDRGPQTSSSPNTNTPNPTTKSPTATIPSLISTPSPTAPSKLPSIKPTPRPTIKTVPGPLMTTTMDLNPTPRPTRKTVGGSLMTTTMDLSPTPRPTRITNQFGSLFTTTMAQDVQYGFAITADVDEGDSSAQPEIVHTANMSPLYYVIGALLISICYISFSLFCWVTYNQKYQDKIMTLRRQKQQNINDEHAMISHVPLSTRSAKSKISPKANTFSLSPTSHRSSSTKAPTTIPIERSSRNSSWNIEDEEFKEVDYETGGGQQIEEEDEEQQQNEEVYLVEEAVRDVEYESMSSVDLDIIEDDMDIMQYGEDLNVDIDDAVMHEVNGLSAHDYEYSDDSQHHHQNAIYEDECKQIIYSTPGSKAPVSFSGNNNAAYPQMPVASPYLVNVGQSISLSGSGNTTNRQKYHLRGGHGHHIHVPGAVQHWAPYHK